MLRVFVKKKTPKSINGFLFQKQGEMLRVFVKKIRLNRLMVFARNAAHFWHKNFL